MSTRIEGDRALIVGQPCIVISNHQSTVDIAVLGVHLNGLGQSNIRWILKESLRKAPVIGWIAQLIGCAFVSRDKNPQDVEAIRQCACILREDGAAILLFPEGTRFTPDRATQSFRRVLP